MSKNDKRDSFLLVTLPYSDESECHEIRDPLVSGWITTGPKTHKFDTIFVVAVGAKYAIAVNSYTAATYLSLEALGTKGRCR